MKKLFDIFSCLFRDEGGFFNIKFVVIGLIAFFILYSLYGVIFSGFGRYFFG